jgi:hypothetical protein
MTIKQAKKLIQALEIEVSLDLEYKDKQRIITENYQNIELI